LGGFTPRSQWSPPLAQGDQHGALDRRVFLYKWSARKPDRIEGRFQSSQPFHKLFHEEGPASAAMIKDDISSRRMIIFSISIPPLISS
jgi:hypothetical protein